MNIGNRFKIENDRIIKISNGEILPEDEPLFLLRARDHLALETLLHYREQCKKDNCNDYLLNLIDEVVCTFADFRLEHPEKMKQPGITRGK